MKKECKKCPIQFICCPIQKFIDKYSGLACPYAVVLMSLVFIVASFGVIQFISLLWDTCVKYFLDSNESIQGAWISGLGSFFGGVVGGLATLFALRITINTNKADIEAHKAELKKKETQKKEEQIRKSALTIFYDFQFAFENIHEFRCFFWRNQTTNVINILTDEDIPTFIAATRSLNQFYFDSDWIKTVSTLSDCPSLGLPDIKVIYEIYGHLMTIQKAIDATDTTNPLILKKAYEAMDAVMFYTIPLNKHDLPDYELSDEVENIMKKLDEIINKK